MQNNTKHKKKVIEYHASKRSIVIMLVIWIAVSLFGIFYVRNMKSIIYQSIYRSIEDFGTQKTVQLNYTITEQKNMLNLIIEYVDRGYIRSIDELLVSFEDKINEYQFTRIAVLDSNGNGKTSDGIDITNYPNIDEFFQQSKFDVYITETRPSAVSNDEFVNIFAKCFTINGADMILIAAVDSSEYHNLLGSRLFGKGGTYLISSDGKVLIDPFGNIIDNSQTLYDYFTSKYHLTNKNELEKIDDMISSIIVGREGTFDIEFIDENVKNSNKETYFIHYDRLDINDWYVVTTASDSSIAYQFIRLEIVNTFLYLILICVIVIASIYTISSIQKKNHRIYDIAYIDPVTGLGNETYFMENGVYFLADKTPDEKYVLSIDINKFKALNSIHGYAFCNSILKELGTKLSELLPANNITCRISNDIFASMFNYSGNIEEYIEKTYNELSILTINDHNIQLNLAIGVYHVLPDEKEVNKILDKSYMARSQVKGLYDNNYYLFDEALENRLLEVQRLESNMKTGLDRKEFLVYYQPKVYAATGKVYGAEALVRWVINGEMLPPSRFIPLFEKNRFIRKLDLYIFDIVCQDISEWQKRSDFIPTISVNISKEHFVDENFIDEFVGICEKYNVDPSIIDLEITESATIDEKIDILPILNRIKEKGFIISIDDFGTGYSSFSMLQNMPIDIIKIDKVFISKANLSSKYNIINYIILIAKHLRAKTIVEGVETQEQVDFVNSIHADIIQGYFFSKPLPKDIFEDYFRKNI